MKKIRRKLGEESGSIFLLAMLALVVLMILGVAFTSRSINALYLANKDRQDKIALSLAECGVDLALAELYESRRTVPFEVSVELASGNLQYSVQPEYNGIADTVVVLSTGITRRHVRATVRVVARGLNDVDINRVFRGAIFSDNPLTLNGSGTVNPDANGEGGDIYAGGNIRFNGTSFTMPSTGHIYTTGTTNWYPTNIPSSNVYEHISPIPMPIIDLNWYRTHATQVINGNYTVKDNFNLDGITYVTGDVKLSGNYTGRGLIVAAGSISVTGNVLASNSAGDTLVLMSPTSVKLAGNPRVDGLIYAHNVTDAGVTISGNADIRGAIIADVVTTNGSITVTYSDVWKDLPLPGDNEGFVQLQQLSWQRLQ